MRARRRGPGRGETEPADDASDAALVAFAQRRPEGYERLYRRYWDPVFRYCYYRLGAWEDAEDAASEVFADALGRLSRFEDRDDSFRSWLFWIAHNEVVSRYRGTRAVVVSLEGKVDLADLGPTPEEAALASDAHREVHQLLARLPDDQRRVCELRLAGLKGKEIAAVLDKSHDAVRAVQYRAEARLRGLLGVAAPPKEAPHA